MLGISRPVFDNIFTTSILGMWEKNGFIPHAGVLLPNEPISNYRCMDLHKTDDNDRTHKNDANILS